MENQINIDAQALVNRLAANNAAELAAKNAQIANLQVTVDTLKSQLEKTQSKADEAKED